MQEAEHELVGLVTNLSSFAEAEIRLRLIIMLSSAGP